VIEHRHCFEELLRVADLLPAGDIAMPTESLTHEWFYMTFHKSEREQFMSMRRLNPSQSISNRSTILKRAMAN